MEQALPAGDNGEENANVVAQRDPGNAHLALGCLPLALLTIFTFFTTPCFTVPYPTHGGEEVLLLYFEN